jgi:large subunit ribosomal protein L6
MSRIGKKIIPKESGVEVSQDTSTGVLSVKGPKGALQIPTENRVRLIEEEKHFALELLDLKKPQFWGLYNRLLANAIQGVKDFFVKDLELIGTGYRAALENKALKLTIGFSHPVLVQPEEGVSFETPQPTRVKVLGIQKDLVGRVAAEIRDLRPPEPYHGKGIRYLGEKIALKVGKSTAKK